MIDCDIHNVPASIQTLFPYLSDHWKEYMTQSAFRGPTDTAYPKNAPTTARPETRPASGGPPGSDLSLIRQQALDAWGAEYGILNCAYAVDGIHNPDTATAVASAVNDWQIAEWLDQEPRLRASIVVPSHQPEMAAREIDRVGEHPGFVQVFLPVRSEALYGNRRYHPIFEAAVRRDLAVGIHFGGAPGNPPTSSGWPSYYVEDYVDMAAVFQSQVLNMIVEGLFDRFPTLRVALIEGGFTWLPGLIWRIDKEWKGLRREVPWNKGFPSRYIHEHIRVTTQPVDAPPNPRQLLQVIDQIGSDDVLMFATDYPHWQFDGRDDAFPIKLPETLERKIMSENARAFYRL
ncbi:MAG: amidohydrolase family protein [Chloroflexota bacterium]